MAVYLAWIGAASAVDRVTNAPGPWQEILEAAPGLLLIESDASLSRIYHEMKWLLPDSRGLLVAPLAERPKARGLTGGTVSWLRERLPLAASGA